MILKAFKPAEIKFELKRMLSILPLAVFACVLWVVRDTVLGERLWFSMIWNMFLAWVPYGFACLMLIINTHKDSKWWKLSLLPLGALWLLFFPNAPYMLTTYIHFNFVGFIVEDMIIFGIQPWYDFVFFTSAILSGVLAGLASLIIIHKLLEKYFTKIIAWGAIIIINFLSSWAIYLGRFIRFNSWDIFNDPLILLPYIMLSRGRVLFIFLFGVFLFFLYVAVYNFSDYVKREAV